MAILLEPSIQRTIKYVFQKHSVENPELEKAITDIFISILTDSTILGELTEKITKIQEQKRIRLERFRG